MMISNNLASTSTRLSTATRVVTQPKAPLDASTALKSPTGPSAKMQEYINKSKESPSTLTGGKMIEDLSSRAESLGAEKLNANSKGFVAFIKSTSLYQFFFGSGDGKDGGNVTKTGEGLNDATGHFSEMAIKGPDDALKLGSKGELDLETQKAALHGRGLSDEETMRITGKAPEPDKGVTDADKVNSGFGIATSGIAFIKSAYDGKEALNKFGECSELSNKAKEKSNEAIDVQQMRVNIGSIASGDVSSMAVQNLMTGAYKARTAQGAFTPRPPDAAKISALAQEITAVLPHIDPLKLEAALTAKVKNQPLTTEQTQLFNDVGNALNIKSMALMDESNALKQQASVGRREAGMELAKSVSGMTEKATNISSKIIDITSKAATPLATAAAVTGIAATVGATIELAISIHSAVKASGVENAMKALRNPSEESLTEAKGNLESKAKNIQAKADKLPLGDPKRDTLLAQVKQLTDTAEILGQTVDKLKNGTLKPEDLKIKSTKLDAAAKQVEKRQGFWSKVGNAIIAALKVAAGIAATVAVFAGAVCLAATPVGWALGAAAIVGGIAMGCYKAHQAYGRWKQNENLAEMKTNVSNKLTEIQTPATYASAKTEAETKLQQTKDEIRDQKADLRIKTDRLDQMDIADPDYVDLSSEIDAQKDKIKVLESTQKNLETSVAVNQFFVDHPTTLKEGLPNPMPSLPQEVQQGVEQVVTKIAETAELKKDISIMQCRKDPEFAATQILKNLTPDLTVTDPGKKASRELKKLEAESLVEALGMPAESLKGMAPADAKKKLMEFLSPS